MEDEVRNFLFQKLFRNGVFDLIYRLQDLEQLYIYLVSAEAINLRDKYGIIYTQMQVVNRDLKTLQDLIDRNITKEFRSKKDEMGQE